MSLLNKMPRVYEPKRKNRFLFRFPSDLGIQEWYVESSSRPSISQGATEIQFMNTSTYVLGRYTWDEMNITFRDPIGPSASQATMERVRHGSESVTGRQGYAAGYKRDIELEMLDPSGNVVEKWVIVGAFLTNVKFDDLNYSQDDIATITATLRPDYCILAF